MSKKITIVTIKELAQNFQCSPEQLLRMVREAGIDKSGVTDSLSVSERAKMVRFFAEKSTDGQSPGGGRWKRADSGGARGRSGSTQAGKTLFSGRGSARSVTVKVRGQTFTQNSRVGRSAPPPASKAASEVSKPKPTQVRRKVYSAETGKVIEQVNSQAEAPDTTATTPEAASAPQTKSAPRTDDSGKPLKASAQEAPTQEAQANEAAAHEKQAQATQATDQAVENKSEPGSVQAAETTDHDDDQKPASGKEKFDKHRASGGKRINLRRTREELIGAEAEEDDYSLADEATTDSVEDAADHRPFNYLEGKKLEIKKNFRKRRKVKTKIRNQSTNVHVFQEPVTKISLQINLPETITIEELAHQLRIKRSELRAHIKQLKIDSRADALDQASAALIVEHLGHKPVELELDNLLLRAKKRLKYRGKEVAVSPVVAIMGHVDHGKTTLIDRLRKTNTADKEYGSITQHIGAYQVPVEGGSVTFLDTPGHAAFAHMREHGARVTDLVVIVVAADDGVKPQTIESIEYAQRYKLPIVVAVNKIDKEGANSELTKQAMSEHNVTPEEWGGDNLFIEISALHNRGIDKLLEAIHLQAEMTGQKVPIDGDGYGYVIESGQRKGLGVAATVLLKKGAMEKNQIVSAGNSWGRIRFLLDENDQRIKRLTPSTPALLIGLNRVVEAGSEIFVTSESSAREIEEYIQQKNIPTVPEIEGEIDAEALFADLEKKKQMTTLNLHIKTDVQGSTTAIRKMLEELSNPEFKINLTACRQGGIYESDVQTAASTGSTIIGFNVSLDSSVNRLAESSSVEIHCFRSVYEIYEYVSQLVIAGTKAVLEYTKVGTAEVREVFKSSSFGLVAGCIVVDGAVHKNDVVRVMRSSQQIYEGRVDSLRRFKDDVKTVEMGSECGIAVNKFDDMRPGDIVEAYTTKEVQPSLPAAG